MTLTGITSWGDAQTRYFDATGEIGGPPAPAAIVRRVVTCMT
jgi:hypothetical protein